MLIHLYCRSLGVLVNGQLELVKLNRAFTMPIHPWSRDQSILYILRWESFLLMHLFHKCWYMKVSLYFFHCMDNGLSIQFSFYWTKIIQTLVLLIFYTSSTGKSCIWFLVQINLLEWSGVGKSFNASLKLIYTRHFHNC